MMFCVAGVAPGPQRSDVRPISSTDSTRGSTGNSPTAHNSAKICATPLSIISSTAWLVHALSLNDIWIGPRSSSSITALAMRSIGSFLAHAAVALNAELASLVAPASLANRNMNCSSGMSSAERSSKRGVSPGPKPVNPSSPATALVSARVRLPLAVSLRPVPTNRRMVSIPMKNGALSMKDVTTSRSTGIAGSMSTPSVSSSHGLGGGTESPSVRLRCSNDSELNESIIACTDFSSGMPAAKSPPTPAKSDFAMPNFDLSPMASSNGLTSLSRWASIAFHDDEPRPRRFSLARNAKNAWNEATIGRAELAGMLTLRGDHSSRISLMWAVVHVIRSPSP